MRTGQCLTYFLQVSSANRRGHRSFFHKIGPFQLLWQSDRARPKKNADKTGHTRTQAAWRGSAPSLQDLLGEGRLAQGSDQCKRSPETRKSLTPAQSVPTLRFEQGETLRPQAACLEFCRLLSLGERAANPTAGAPARLVTMV
jgi:hypothetical protein